MANKSASFQKKKAHVDLHGCRNAQVSKRKKHTMICMANIGYPSDGQTMSADGQSWSAETVQGTVME